ncbi:unnamed protein product [Linum tenue]|uniref:Chitinase domain-containing protein 1 n=1 Tax=Linum tenue TaxID=586396 RepID=A0AAV0PFS8_9ROSI|nr:unnamed protein product [Linum tenue]
MTTVFVSAGQIPIRWSTAMAKRRNLRAAPSTGRRQTRAENPTQENKFDEVHASDRRLLLIFFAFFVVIPAVSVCLYRFKFAPEADRSDPIEHGQKQGGRFKVDMNYQEILEENSEVSLNASRRNYAYPVLAYVTPWNSKGYDVAKKYTKKFTHISPVWYDLKSQGSGLVLDGRHNADTGWMSELRQNGDALVIPRIVLEAVPQELLKSKKLRSKAIDIIVTECMEMEFDGIVLESWSRWAAYGILHDPDMRNKALQFVKQLGDTLHSVSSAENNNRPLQLVYVIGPPVSEKPQMHDFGPQDLQRLSGAVDGFSLMTYDFSSPQNPGPNAPLKWIKFALQQLLGPPENAQNLAPKIYLGLNFYGNDFSISGGNFLLSCSSNDIVGISMNELGLFRIPSPKIDRSPVQNYRFQRRGYNRTGLPSITGEAQAQIAVGGEQC